MSPGLGEVDLFGSQGRKDNHLLPRPGDGDIEAAFTAIAVHGAEVHRNSARGIGAVADGEEDDIPLIALNIFQVLDKNRLSGSVGKIGFDLRMLAAGLLQQVIDQLLLGLAEGDNTYAEIGSLRVEQPAQHLADNGSGLSPIGPALALVIFTDDMTERDPKLLMGRGEGKQPVAVIMVITEGDQTFMAATVVPI